MKYSSLYLHKQPKQDLHGVELDMRNTSDTIKEFLRNIAKEADSEVKGHNYVKIKAKVNKNFVTGTELEVLDIIEPPLNSEKMSNGTNTHKTANKIVPDFGNLSSKFTSSIVATPKGMNNFPWGEDSVANWITYFANLKQDNGKPFELLGWKVNDNEYT